MSVIKRIVSIIGLAIVWTAGPWYVAVIWCCAHIVWFRGSEVIVVALMVDVFYRTIDTVPWYTIGAICGVLLYEWLRSRLFIYNT